MARNPIKPSTETVIHGSTIRFEEPKSSRGQKQKGTIIITPPEVHPVTGFISFLREYAVVGVAIGFIIGLQAQTLMKQLVTSFIDPMFNLFFGQALSLRTFTIHFGDRSANFAWGSFAYSLLNFLFFLAAIYIIVKAFKIDKIDKPDKDKKK